jgi:hypothetical protein
MNRKIYFYETMEEATTHTVVAPVKKKKKKVMDNKCFMN